VICSPILARFMDERSATTERDVTKASVLD